MRVLRHALGTLIGLDGALGAIWHTSETRSVPFGGAPKAGGGDLSSVKGRGTETNWGEFFWQLFCSGDPWWGLALKRAALSIGGSRRVGAARPRGREGRTAGGKPRPRLGPSPERHSPHRNCGRRRGGGGANRSQGHCGGFGIGLRGTLKWRRRGADSVGRDRGGWGGRVE
ncbi:hypothetical protein SKAU_G00316600 [Synaphobranchus kaupii]|uniref:Uncharacterized protein n=1 Tax=Synaphobranchus kaupii TaxID=118154 RepID=A0A9Q1ESP8_SYNKA|nr:hypothetical protein SKAU_G00316600 [Synaphobranchus kaupii]